MTTAGKTYGVLIPWIHAALRSGQSVVAIDVKGDLLDEIQKFGQRHGSSGARAAKWDFADPSRSISWSWIAELTSEDSIDAAVAAIIGRERPNSSADPFFHRRDSVLLRGLLAHALATAGRVASASDLLAILGDRKGLQRVAGHRGSPGSDDLASAITGLDDHDYGKAVSGVSTALARLNTAAIASVSRPGKFNIADIAKTPTLLVVGAQLAGGDRSVVTSSLFLNLFMAHAYRGFLTRSPRRTFLFLDEAARLANRFQFEEALSVSRGAGVSLVIAVQSPEQFREPSERGAIMENCGTLIALPGSSSATAQTVSDRFGRHTVTTMTTARGTGSGGVSMNRSFEDVPVLRSTEIMSPPLGQRPAVAHIKAPDLGITFKPILIDLQDNH